MLSMIQYFSKSSLSLRLNDFLMIVASLERVRTSDNLRKSLRYKS